MYSFMRPDGRQYDFSSIIALNVFSTSMNGSWALNRVNEMQF